MSNDPRKNILNCALSDMSSGELKCLLENLGYRDDMQVHESPEYEAWDFKQWYKPDEHQLTQAEFNAKYGNNRNPKRAKADGPQPGAI